MPALQVQSDARPGSLALEMCEGTQQETTSIQPQLESQQNTRNTLNNQAATWHHISLPFV